MANVTAVQTERYAAHVAAHRVGDVVRIPAPPTASADSLASLVLPVAEVRGFVAQVIALEAKYAHDRAAAAQGTV